MASQKLNIIVIPPSRNDTFVDVCQPFETLSFLGLQVLQK